MPSIDVGAVKRRKGVAQFLAAGSRLVWALDPRREEARVYRADGTESALTSGEALSGEGVLPGFTCPLSDLFST